MNIVIIRENKKCELASTLLKACPLMHTAHIHCVLEKNDQTMCKTAALQKPPSQGHKMRQNEK